MVLGMDSEEILVRLSEELRLRAFSPKTVKAYTFHAVKFLRWLGRSSLPACPDDVRRYMLQLEGYDVNTLRQARFALEFLFRWVLEKKVKLDIPIPKRKQTLPKVLSKQVQTSVTYRSCWAIQGWRQLQYTLMLRRQSA